MADALTKSVASDGRSDLQRERILHVAASLFARKGFQAVGVAELGNEVGLGRGALYYHIGSKEELLFEIVSRYITELVKTGETVVSGPADPRRKVEALSRHMLEIVSRNRAEMTVCFRESECLTGGRQETARRLHSRYQALWIDVFAEGYRSGTFRELPPVAVKGLLGMYFHSFLWMKPGGRNSAAQIADVFADIVLRALKPDPATELAVVDELPRVRKLAIRAAADAPSRSTRSQGRALARGTPSASPLAKP